MANKDTSKQWFEMGDFPTQAQFAQVFDWLRWKDEAIAISDITNLQTILNNFGAAAVDTFIITGSHVYTILAGFLLEKIIVMPLTDCTVRVDNEGDIIGGDILAEQEVLAAQPLVAEVNVLAMADRNIVVFDVPAGSTLKFIKRKI